MNEDSVPERVLVERVGEGVVSLRLNRAETRNAMDWEAWSSLRDVLHTIRLEGQARVVVLGSTSPFFSSGGDVKKPPNWGYGPLSALARLELAHDVLQKIRSFPHPVIAAVEGGAVGIAWSLALACDLVIAAEDAVFSAPFLSRGAVPDGGISWLLVERLGRQRATEILLTGAALSASDAQHAGLVNRVVPSGSTQQVAEELAESLRDMSADAVELTKRLLSQTEGSTLETFLPLELGLATVTQLRRT